jgi:hypothetical protein
MVRGGNPLQYPAFPLQPTLYISAVGAHSALISKAGGVDERKNLRLSRMSHLLGDSLNRL